MFKNKNIKIFGHRGAAGLAFENSLPAIQRALDEGVDGIEIDVWKTTDDEIVVFHDAYLDRLTDKSGLIRHLSSREIKSIKLKSGDAIPTLLQVVQLVQQSNVQLLVEDKRRSCFGPNAGDIKQQLSCFAIYRGLFFSCYRTTMQSNKPGCANCHYV